MKASLIASLVLSSLLAMNAQAGLFQGQKAIKGIAQAGVTKDVYSGVKFQYFDQTDRIQIINDLFRSIEAEYALLPIKKARLGLDTNKLKAEAIEAEMQSANILLTAENRSNLEMRTKIANLQAKSNMDFLDRMQLLVAKFQDTHFSLQERISRPLIYTGLRFRKVQGYVFLGSIDRKFMGMVQKLSGSDLSAIKPGDVLVSVDGVPVADKVNELKQFVAGSSDEFRETEAIRSLTIRNLNYPTKNYVTLEFQNAGVFKIPFFVNIPKDGATRPDALTYLQSIGVPSDSAAIGMTYDKNTRQWVDTAGFQFEGYSPWKLHFNLKGLTEYADDNGSPGMRTGYYMKNGKSYGVMQILTFSTRNLTVGGNALSFTDAIRGFVSELKENGIPLIIDLRSNPGGNGRLPPAVLSILAKKDSVLGNYVSGYRMTPYIRQLQEPGLIQEVVAEDVTFGITNDDFANMLQTTIDNRKELTPMYSAMPIVTDQTLGGFENKIVALVGADCISSCDIMASLLKSSNRATLIGTHSNGTGAGFLSTSDLNTQWTDSLRVFSSQIPNHLFGVADQNPMIRIFGEDSALEKDLENRPTVADVQYSATIKDLTKNNTGWLDKAVETIEAMK